MTGITASAASARRASMLSMMATMPSSVSTSMKMVIAPAANISLITSTSVVRRVTSRPTGLRSKKRIGSRCTCAKTCDAEVGEALLRHQHRQVVLQVEEHALAEDRARRRSTPMRASPVGVAGGDVAVDRELQEIRLRAACRPSSAAGRAPRARRGRGTDGCRPTGGGSGARRRPCRAPPPDADRAPAGDSRPRRRDAAAAA